MSNGERYICEDLLTIRDLVNAFDVTMMTVYNWRKKKKLPYVVIPGEEKPIIRFYPNEVEHWAEVHDKTIKRPWSK